MKKAALPPAGIPPATAKALQRQGEVTQKQPPPATKGPSITTNEAEGVGNAPTGYKDAAYVPPGAKPVDVEAMKAINQRTTEQMMKKTFVPDRLPAGPIPTAESSQAMADGKYDFARLNADIQKQFGISGIQKAPPGAVALFPVATHGVWASELTLAMKAFEAAGYTVKIATLDGKAPMFLPVSVNENFKDPTWGAGWVAKGEAELGWQVQKQLLEMEKKGQIVKLDGLIPARPQAADGPEKKKAYGEALQKGLAELSNVRQTMIPGGTGAIIDLADNSQVEALIEQQHNAGNPVGGICYGALALLNADDGALMGATTPNGRDGIKLTIHNRADDFVTGTGALTDAGVAKLRAYVEANDLNGFMSDGSVWTSEWRSPTVKAEVTAEAIGGAGAQVISPYNPGSMAVIDATRLEQGKGVIATGRSIHCGLDTALGMIAHALGNEPIKDKVLMLADGAPARTPKKVDYNAQNPEIWG